MKALLKAYLLALKQEFRGYNHSSLLKDLMAGLTVTAVALPLALAFGVSSGADAAAGLITAIIAGLAISLLSGGYYQISGPTGAMAAILISIMVKHQMQGVLIATLMAGMLLVLAGVLRLGKLTTFLPVPVITGFTSGIAIIIALGQLDNFFGVRSEGESALLRLASFLKAGHAPDLAAVGVGLFVILFMVVFPKKWSAIVPASLLAIILATVLTSLLGLDVAVVGEIPRTLMPASRLNLAGIDLAEVADLAAPAVSIAMLGMIESLLCGASAGRMTGVPLNNDQELVAQGIGNMILPFFGGIPATAAIARTSVAIKSGAKTRLTGIIHAIGLLISMFVLSPVMSRIPLAGLAGILIVTAWRMNEWDMIHYIFSRKFKGAILKFLATMIATVVFDLTVAILIGFFVALILMVRRLSMIEINYEKVDMSRISNKDEALNRRYSMATVVYITGPAIFANTQSLLEIPAALPSDCDTVLFSMRGVSHMDISGAHILHDMFENLKEKGIDIMLCGVPKSTMVMMERSGICDLLGENSYYWSVERALLDQRPEPGFTIKKVAQSLD